MSNTTVSSTSSRIYLVRYVCPYCGQASITPQSICRTSSHTRQGFQSKRNIGQMQANSSEQARCDLADSLRALGQSFNQDGVYVTEEQVMAVCKKCGAAQPWSMMTIQDPFLLQIIAGILGVCLLFFLNKSTWDAWYLLPIPVCLLVSLLPMGYIFREKKRLLERQNALALPEECRPELIWEPDKIAALLNEPNQPHLAAVQPKIASTESAGKEAIAALAHSRCVQILKRLGGLGLCIQAFYIYSML